LFLRRARLVLLGRRLGAKIGGAVRLAERIELRRKILTSILEKSIRRRRLPAQNVVAGPCLRASLGEPTLAEQRTAELDPSDPGVDVRGTLCDCVAGDGVAEQPLGLGIVLLQERGGAEVRRGERDEVMLLAVGRLID